MTLANLTGVHSPFRNLTCYNCNNLSTYADFGRHRNAYADEADKEGFIENTSVIARDVFSPFLLQYYANSVTAGNTQQDPVSHFLHFIVSCIAASFRQIQRILQLALLVGREG